MSPYLWWIISLAVIVGHFGLNIAIYNRVNGFGLPRRTIKMIVKFFFLLTLALPVLAAVLYGDVILDLWKGRPNELPIPMPL